MNVKKPKSEIYEAILPQIEFLFVQESDLTANLANTVALLKSSSLPFFWIGFYIVKGSELVLGPFQGLPATSRIGFGAGVCGTCWKEKSTILVPDVLSFPGHIACNCFSQSEIAAPVIIDDKVVAVLDIDSDRKDDFDESDRFYLEKVTEVLSKNWKGDE